MAYYDSSTLNMMFTTWSPVPRRLLIIPNEPWKPGIELISDRTVDVAEFRTNYVRLEVVAFELLLRGGLIKRISRRIGWDPVTKTVVTTRRWDVDWALFEQPVTRPVARADIALALCSMDTIRAVDQRRVRSLAESSLWPRWRLDILLHAVNLIMDGDGFGPPVAELFPEFMWPE
jgi:hypothetical protein